jgi:4-carboxymuconolactone decarboxylase
MSGQRLTPLVLETLTEEQRRTYDAVAAGRRGHANVLGGRIAGPLTIWLHAPLIGKTQQALGAVLRFDLSLRPRVAELVILSVAHDARSGFQILAHEAMASDAGLTHEQIEALRDGREPDLDDPVELTAWRTAARLLRAGDLDDAEYDEAVTALGEQGLVELVTLVGYYRLLALQIRVFGVSADEYRGPRLPASTAERDTLPDGD